MTATLTAEVASLRPDHPPTPHGRVGRSDIRTVARPALSAGKVRHRAGRGALYMVTVPPECVGLGRHRARLVSLSRAYCLLITTVYVLHLAAGQTWAWERRRHESIVGWVETALHVAVLLLLASGLLLVGVRSA